MYLPLARKGSSHACETVRHALGFLAHDASLTPVLQERLLEISGGLSYHQISARHNISVNTVKTEVRNLLQRLGGLSCRHEIEDAVNAAFLRAETGATPEEIRAFLLVRFE